MYGVVIKNAVRVERYAYFFSLKRATAFASASVRRGTFALVVDQINPSLYAKFDGAAWHGPAKQVWNIQ